MATVEILGTVAAVLRCCRVCGEWKTLEHFLIYHYVRALPDGREEVVGSKKVCATCRRPKRQPQ